MKQNIYDIKSFSDAYDKMRYENKGMNANDLVEIPNFRKLIPDVKGKEFLTWVVDMEKMISIA